MRLCRRHVERCRRCQQAWQGTDSLAQFLVTAEQVPAGLDLRPEVRAGIAGLRTTLISPAFTIPQRNRPLRWAIATALVLLFIGTGLWLAISLGPNSQIQVPAVVQPEAQTKLFSASIENRPARIFLIKSRNPDRTIFWIARNNKRS
jgi:hypothetical protein